MWGVNIYTDDSDPLAAAIHSGWICGEWGEGVHLSMLAMDHTGKQKAPSNQRITSSLSETTLSNPPSTPMQPIPGKDLHLVLLVLPTLQRYASLTRNGIKSRSWGDNHDGMSFKIEKIAWVDDGAGHGEERNGEARRKRMKSLVEPRSIAAGPPVHLTMIQKTSDEMEMAAVGA